MGAATDHLMAPMPAMRLQPDTSRWSGKRHGAAFRRQATAGFNQQRSVQEVKRSATDSPMLSLFSPSKINLFLRITGKRSDGYHELASLFHVISLGDILEFSISPSEEKDSLTSNVSGIPLDESNLVVKALDLYRKKTGFNMHFSVHLDKRVPSGAGLGGGSGNAATALWAANNFNGGVVSEKELQEWSGEIGSDIPFFFSHGAAYCTGRGEIVKDIPSGALLDIPMLLVKPKEACPTALVYKHFRLDQASNVDPEKLLEQLMNNGVSQDVCVNDLETPAFEVLRSLKPLKHRIQDTGKYKCVFMSGSGSTLVCIGDTKAPQFLSQDEQHRDTFVCEARFLTRGDKEWFKQP